MQIRYVDSMRFAPLYTKNSLLVPAKPHPASYDSWHSGMTIGIDGCGQLSRFRWYPASNHLRMITIVVALILWKGLYPSPQTPQAAA